METVGDKGKRKSKKDKTEVTGRKEDSREIEMEKVNG